MHPDISRQIISTEIVKQRIGTMFPDCAILDQQLRFVAVSQNILDATGYSRGELLQKSVSCFSRTVDLQSFVIEKLRFGYFADEHFEIHDKIGNPITYSVSGFYLGLISDTNGLIVLRFKNQDEISQIHDSLESKTAEIDRFVYVSAHALRGPLATMKGLINLAKTYDKSDELTFLIDQLHLYSEKLDDKLHKLIYFAESDKGYEASSRQISLPEVVKQLDSSIQDCHVDHRINFRCISGDEKIRFENGEVVLSLLRNLVYFFCQQVKDCSNELTLDVHSSEHSIEVVLYAKGFVPSNLLKAKLSAINFSYSEILNYPELINYYAVKKIVFKLRGDIQFVLTQANEVTVLIVIPKEVKLSAK
jgi:hypothetical protein